MKNSAYIYRVAGHCFEIAFEYFPFLDRLLKQNYAPFVVEGDDMPLLFKIQLCDDVLTDDILQPIYVGGRDTLAESVLRVAATSQGWLFELTQPFSTQANACVRIDRHFSHAQVALRGTEQQATFAFNCSVMLCYMLASSHQTILPHASCVVNGGCAYLFLGKSGTGKSTHSNLWLQHIDDTYLLNDDHPMLRLDVGGRVIVYGSPWSGKTPCYRNESAPVGGVVRICRASANSICRLKPVEAYASLTTGFSGMEWNEPMADARHAMLEHVIGSVACYTLSCLPDADAARVCHQAVALKPKE